MGKSFTTSVRLIREVTAVERMVKISLSVVILVVTLSLKGSEGSWIRLTVEQGAQGPDGGCLRPCTHKALKPDDTRGSEAMNMEGMDMMRRRNGRVMAMPMPGIFEIIGSWIFGFLAA